MDRRHIFAHRGLWVTKSEQNSINSFVRAFDSGFSIETDMRMDAGRAIISHDSQGLNYLHAEKLLDFNGRFALNLKSDGLLDYAKEIRDWLGKTQSFFFDCSVPEQYKYVQNRIPIADRLSEFERTINFDSKWVWLDSFEFDWWGCDSQVREILTDSNKLIIFVSPELHGRNNEKSWLKFRQLFSEGFNFGVCTDFPEALSNTLGI